MNARARLAEALLASRRRLLVPPAAGPGAGLDATPHKGEAEGGCGVIGIACADPIPARHLLQALQQMRNRGNNKGGGVAAVGLDAAQFGTTREILERDYLLGVAYLDPAARAEVEKTYIEPIFEVDHHRRMPSLSDHRAIPGLEIAPPEVHHYFVRVRPSALDEFIRTSSVEKEAADAALREGLEDEIVYQNSYRLNQRFYAAAGGPSTMLGAGKRAFVLSHGKDMLVLKMVGYGDDVVRYYQLEDLRAHVWIGHHRYPTKGRVWHPGGAHPFVGLHEALVHNGDFANYSSICEYLAQRNIHPLFLTDTEVSVLVFDLLHRTYGYPLEYVIEALAPTTERDFTLLPPEKQEIYQMLQRVHIHGSPDGPWFFLVAQSDPAARGPRLIGITDTSMLRPQVFALQEGAAPIGFAASEKQAIDAALASLAAEDPRFWSRADRYWSARGGSHTDGGAFVFEVERASGGGFPRLVCTDKFGRAIRAHQAAPLAHASASRTGLDPRQPAQKEFARLVEALAHADEAGATARLAELEEGARQENSLPQTVEALTLLLDRRYPTGSLPRSRLLSLVDASLARVWDSIRRQPKGSYAWMEAGSPRPQPAAAGSPDQTLVVDARGFAPEGDRSLALELVALHRAGWRRFRVVHTRGHRFLGGGFGPGTNEVQLDIYGSPGDYLASGIDGARVVVHGDAQDQLAQIMKHGELVIHGDVGQTFMYAAKGGRVFVLGNAAGRPLINAVGRPRVVINGTCLDYLAESFMAGDPLNGGGFVILNGITFAADGGLVELETPYPGGNLFALASGGAIYLRDPHARVSADQLNGGEFKPLDERDWELIRPHLEENERLFGIPLGRLLETDGRPAPPDRVYRKVVPRAERALQAEEAWVRAKA